MRLSRLVIGIATTLTCLVAHAANPIKISVGDVGLALPIPVGFTEPSNSSPILRARAEKMTVPQFRLLAVYVADSDVHATQSGSAPTFKRYFMAQILRGKEADILDTNAFLAVKSQVIGGQRGEAARPTHDEVQQHISKTARQIGSESGHPQLALTVGEVRQFGIFSETKSSVSTLFASGVPPVPI